MVNICSKTRATAFGNRGPAVARSIFSGFPRLDGPEDVWELNRFCAASRRHKTLTLTAFIGMSCRYIKSKRLQNLLVSFADPTHGHHGGIYQASSWNFHGKGNVSMDGLIIDGIFKPGRSCNSAYGSRSPEKVRQILGPAHIVEPHYDEGKYLYWRALDRQGMEKAKRLELKASPYPKPSPREVVPMPIGQMLIDPKGCGDDPKSRSCHAPRHETNGG